MKEIIEDKTVFMVSESYPNPPYIKQVKTDPVSVISPVDPLTEIKSKMDQILGLLSTIDEQTRPIK